MRFKMTNLSHILQIKNISQAELARRLNITRMTVNIMTKKGIKSVKAAKRYAEILECSWLELIDE